jgi:hypothetical protein
MRQLSILFLLVTLAGCATGGAVSAGCSGGEAPATVQTFYFGTQRDGAPPVSQADWLQFLEHSVTPAFPDGLTWWQAKGQWRDAEGELTEEPSFVLQVLEKDVPEETAKADALMAVYKKQFAQKSVLSTRQRVCAAFF